MWERVRVRAGELEREFATGSISLCASSSKCVVFVRMSCVYVWVRVVCVVYVNPWQNYHGQTGDAYLFPSAYVFFFFKQLRFILSLFVAFCVVLPKYFCIALCCLQGKRALG